MDKQSPYMTVTEAAGLRGCSRQYIHHLLNRQRIPGAVRAGKNLALIPRQPHGGYTELDKFGIAHEVTGE